MHYVILSVSPMAWVSCSCKAPRTHYKGQEKGQIPKVFLASLRKEAA